MSQDRPPRQGKGRPGGQGRREGQGQRDGQGQDRPRRQERPARAPRPVRVGAGSARSATAARMPFVLLVVTLLAGGLISLLLLNAAVNQDSFELNKLQKETTGYTDEQQALQQQVDQYAAPGSLERRARELGMVPGGNPAFLNPDGSVRGTAEAATAAPAPPPTTKAPTTKAPTTPPATTTPAAPSTPTAPTTPPTGTTPPTTQGATTPPPGR